MKYAVRVPGRYTRYVQRLPLPRRRQFLRRFDQLSENPYDETISEALQGRWAGRRKSRIGDYRLIYEVRDAELVVLIVRIGPRGDVYKD